MEGVVALLLVITGTVFGVLFLLNTGLSAAYKEKLAVVTGNAATMVAQNDDFLGFPRRPDELSGGDQNIRTAVNQALHNMGLPDATRIDITREGAGDAKTATVTIAVSGLAIFSGGILPQCINMEEKASVPYARYKPAAVLGLTATCGGSSSGVYIPCYGAGNNCPGPPAPVPVFDPPVPYYSLGFVTGCPIAGYPKANNDGGGPWTPPVQHHQ